MPCLVVFVAVVLSFILVASMVKWGAHCGGKPKFAINHYTEVRVHDTTCNVSGLKSALKLCNVEDGSSNLESSSSLQQNDHGS